MLEGAKWVRPLLSMLRQTKNSFAAKTAHVVLNFKCSVSFSMVGHFNEACLQSSVTSLALKQFPSTTVTSSIEHHQGDTARWRKVPSTMHSETLTLSSMSGHIEKDGRNAGSHLTIWTLNGGFFPSPVRYSLLRALLKHCWKEAEFRNKYCWGWQVWTVSALCRAKKSKIPVEIRPFRVLTDRLKPPWSGFVA